MEYTLGYNYPNPFNANTRLDYSLPVRSHVSVRLYNMLGQEVAVLVNEEQSYGNRYVVWNGLNKQGSTVASGVYIAEFKAGSFLATRKMILMK
jgi:flagellar hook assembly protein FlgD